MATKLSKTIEASLKKLGITTKNEDDARKQLLQRLEEAGIDGMDEETTESLIDMVASFVDDEPENEAPEDPAAEEGEALADEAEEEEEAEEADDDELDDDEEPAPAPAKKAPAKKAAAPAKKEASKPAPKKEKEEKAAPAKKAKKEEKKPKKNDRGVRLRPDQSEADLAVFKKVWGKLFPEKDYDYKVVTLGVNIKNRGSNSRQSALLVENMYVKEGRPAECTVYLMTMNNQQSKDMLDEANVNWEECWNGTPMLKGIPVVDAVEVVTEFLDKIKTVLSNSDKRLGKNREKMEADLKNAAKKAPATKKAAPAPKKEDKPAPAPAKKKVAKK